MREHRTGFGVFLLGTGMGLITNLVTGDPERWPPVLQPVAANAPLIGGVLLAAVAGRAAWDFWRNGIARPEWTGDNPYPGLVAYTEERAGVFFGRRTEVQELVTRVRQARTAAGRFVPVVGPSGSGKSSLVLAGLLPAFRGGTELRVARTFSPGGSAVGELAEVLGADIADDARAAATASRAGDSSPRPRVALDALKALRAGERGLLLVIDQLEEAVTLCVEEDRHSFLALLEAMLEWDPRLRIVATVRSDTVGAFQHGPGRDLFRQPLMVNVLGAREIREIVQEPARLTATAFDDGLIDEIVRDAGGGDALPLLSYLLSDLYRSAARDRRITWREYEAGGGVSGAITRQAQAAVGELGPDALEFCLNTLLRFVTIGPGGATRQPVRGSSLNDRQRRVVQAFVDARLLISDREGDREGDNEGDEVIYYIAHEALLRQWQPLSDHIVLHEENLRRLTELVPMARAWLRSGRQPDYLITGARLEDARSWAGDGHGLPAELRDFLAESQRNQAGEMDRRADQVAERALAQLRISPATGIALALAAYTELAPTTLAARVLEVALADGLVRVLDHGSPVLSLAFDESGWLAAGSEDGTVRRWSRTGERTVYTGLTEPVTAVAFDEDGGFAAAAMDGTIVTWDLDGNKAGALRIADWGVARLVRGGDGRWILGAADGSVRLVDSELRATTVIHAGHSPVYAVAATTDGGAVAGFGDGAVLVWDGRGAEIRQLCGHDDAVFAVAAGHDGDVAAGDRSGRILIWNAAGKVVFETERPGRAVNSLAYGGDGSLACGFVDGTVLVWASDRQPAHVLVGHTAPVEAVAFAPDGRLASGSRDRTVRIWDLGGCLINTTSIEIGPAGNNPAPVHTGRPIEATAPDGRYALAGFDGTISFMDANRSLHYAFHTGYGPVTSLAFTPEGRLAVGHPGVVRIWPYETPPEELLAVAARQPREPLTSQQREDALKGWSRDGGTAS
ncbi:hypothetical protein Ate02nite_36770 [Paractinoplanes tereljensis]|uniref:Novel STAND NTPase 1 domain-containing protein n=1 Tax=Paractinoplanes tereljensis TaxID=571912 RepID=A0A919TUG3_9ACTN|nr:hypothetical protein Ate02nite_36770 [Actinoplanes tereljensis]